MYNPLAMAMSLCKVPLPPAHCREGVRQEPSTSSLFPATMKKRWGYFFPFLCLSATASMTFLVSLYCGFSTQHIVLFLVSGVIVIFLCWLWHLLAWSMRLSHSLPGGDYPSLVSVLVFTILAASRSCLVHDAGLSHSWVCFQRKLEVI